MKNESWRPTATRSLLEQRAAALARVRDFFAAHGVLEVDTPIVVNAPVTDVHIHSAEVRFAGSGSPNATAAANTPAAPKSAPTVAASSGGVGLGKTHLMHAIAHLIEERVQDARGNPAQYFLHTSPEFAMKRLLAAGSGDIYQICHVVRGLERGRHHNAEFTLIEWYRAGFSLEALMDEVEALARHLLRDRAGALKSERITYRDVCARELQLDPFTCNREDLERRARDLGFDPSVPKSESSDLARDSESSDSARDELLELLMGVKIGPRLGKNALTFVHRYPASQAALARLDPGDPRCALRFELYCEGVELANGFHELASHQEQRARFEQDLRERERRGLPTHAMDENLLSALEAGLPDAAGVALGFDRLLMIATGATQIDEVIPFPIERA